MTQSRSVSGLTGNGDGVDVRSTQYGRQSTYSACVRYERPIELSVGAKMSEQELWLIQCHNEWCSGAETYKSVSGDEPGPQACPSCGWLAMRGSGIVRIHPEASSG